MSQAGFISVSGGGGAIQFTTDAGIAVPAAGNVNVLGGVGAATTGAGSTITINVTGAGIDWNVVSTNQTMVVNNGYIATSPGGALTFSLPAASAVGDELILILDGATSWRVTQGAGQTIKLANSVTTAGVAGSLTSTQQGDALHLVCSVANLRWNAISFVGNPTVA